MICFMKSHWKIYCSFLFFVWLNGTLWAAPKPVTLQLVWKNQWQFAGYYMAKEKGYYKKAGLDVRIRELKKGIDVVDEVVGRQADFGIGYSSLVYERSRGKPVVMLAAILQHSPVILLSKKRKDLKTVFDLKGKKIMLSRNQAQMASITAMLQSHGIGLGDIRIISHSFNLDDLMKGKVDAVLAYLSNEPYLLKKAGIAYRIFSPRDHNFDFYSDILFTSETLLKSDPDLVARFYEASLKGWRYAFEHIDETTRTIMKKYNSQHKSYDALAYEAKTLLKLSDYPLTRQLRQR